jgi:uncharacterized protein (DUF302 family)
MSAQQPEPARYGFSKTLDISYADAVEKTRAALKEEGFGVLCEINIKEKLKEKLGVDFRNYVILGACNPPLAYETLKQEINIGLLLPCNVIVYDDDGRTVVAAIDAAKMLSVVGNPTLEATASNITDKLRRVIESIS